MADKKERLDILLVDRGIITSRERAKTSIMAGKVFVDGRRVDKAGEKVPVTANIEYKGEKLPYVSRGGLKLEKAMKNFPITLEGKVCMDIGASTGGFTDCMLQNGASKVFSIDVGYGQFAWKLRTDERVVDFDSIDLSFISLKKIMPATVELLKDNGEVVALIKPQFEAGKEKVGKKGVVRDIEVHKEEVCGSIDYLLEHNLNVLGVSYSPIKGPEGNIEYLVYFTKDMGRESTFVREDVDKVVEASHTEI